MKRKKQEKQVKTILFGHYKTQRWNIKLAFCIEKQRSPISASILLY